MSLSDPDAYTLLIPTHNRSGLLRRLLSYLENRRFEWQVLILDSSSGGELEANRRAASAAALRARHETFEHSLEPYAKFRAGLHLVSTPFVSFCADDDVVFPESIAECVSFLASSPFHVAAHGLYVNFGIEPGAPGEPGEFHVSTTFYHGAGPECPDPFRRVRHQMSNYEASFYAVHRTPVLRDVFDRIQGMRSLLFLELLGSALTAAAGGIRRTRSFYMARNTSVPSIATKGWHPFQFLCMDPQSLFAEYGEYRSVLLDRLREAGGDGPAYDEAHLSRLLDVLHLRYVHPLMAPHILDFILDQAQEGAPPEEVNRRLWGRFVFAGRPPRRRLPYPPRGAARVGGRLRGPLRRVLERVGPRAPSWLERIVEERNDYVENSVTATGSKRIYLLYGDFVEQVLSDGRRVCEEDVRGLLKNLDAYG
jgi:glycosyltransferase domain-containing protein